MQPSKPWYASAGVWGAVVTLAGSVLTLLKVELDPKVLARFPGELSGGMRQRVSIALALSLEPQLMVFDEPTTALDVLVQHAVMDTIISLQQSEGFTAVLISHDLGIVLEATERVLVMHEGRIVEEGTHDDLVAAGGRYADLWSAWST